MMTNLQSTSNSEIINQLNGTEIAVIGMAGRFPGAPDIKAFWQNLRDGVESISFFTNDELIAAGVDPALLNDPHYVKAAPILEDVEMFDAAFFGFTPKEAELIDPQQRLFLECAWQAIEHAGYNVDTYEGAVGVFAGARTNTYLFNLVTNPGLLRSIGAFEIGLGNDLSFMTSRISYKLNLHGPSYSVHTACSTALVAIHLACQSLLLGECQMALAGGVAVNVPQKTGYLYQPGGIVSPDGHCRVFEANSQGTIFGSGVGAVVLKPLEAAIEDRDHIYAVIKGSAINNDGAQKASFTAPGVRGQEEVILDALASAEISPETVSYIETHGTGTSLGDSIEIRALTKVFRRKVREKAVCALGSVKTNLGHLDAAAGIASFIKTVLALQHKVLPPTLHFQTPNPNIGLEDTPFYVNARLANWQRNHSPRRAGVSSFGIGGTNAHVVLEETPALTTSEATRPFQLLLLSARTETALAAATQNLANFLKTAESPLADVAYTLQIGRKTFMHRRIAVCQTSQEGAALLEELGASQVSTGHSEMVDRPAAFLFPGQGAQYVNMARGIYQREPVFREWVDRCVALLKPHMGLDLLGVLYPDEGQQETAVSRLTQTHLAQPALFVIEYALAQLWISWGIRPQAMIGHSIGEYVAACLAGVFSLADALRLVAVRGQLMQGQPEGAMLAVLASEAEIRPFLSPHLSLAAINAPQQCVVAGPTANIETLQGQLTAAGIEHHRLHTSHAFHSAMMDGILDSFAAEVQKAALNPPQIPYLSNVTGTWITAEQATNPRYWAQHLRQTVQFADGIAKLAENSNQVLLEVGPGQTLQRLIRQNVVHTPAHVVLASTRHPQEKQDDLAHLLTALGKLWLAGVSIDWDGFYTHEQRQRCAVPTYPFERQRFWVEAGRLETAVSSHPAPSTGKHALVTDWFYTPSWKRSAFPISQPGQPATKTWLLFDNGSSFAATAMEQLQQTQQRVACVKAGTQFEQLAENNYVINPQHPADYQRLLQTLQQQGQTPDVILHLWNITAHKTGATDKTGFQKAQENGYYSLLFLAQALAKNNIVNPLQLWVLSNHLQQVESQDTIHPEKAPLLGACKVIPQEYEHITCYSLDVEGIPGNKTAEIALFHHLLAEVTTKPAETVIAYRGRQRWAQTYEPIKTLPGNGAVPPLRQHGVYLITGGLGGVGQILAAHLARTVQARLILTGRSALPPKEQWDQWLRDHDGQDATSRKIQTIQTLEAAGAEVWPVAVDVANENQMCSLITQINGRFGQLHGVLHAAGITSGSSVFTPISEIGFAESETQFHPKAYGLYVLEKALQGQPIDFCLLFSSNAAVLGGLGFVAYAASNSFMDAFAIHHSQAYGLPWISANWDHWPEETRQFTGFQTSMEQYTMTRPESEQAFQLAVSLAGMGQVVVSTGDLASRLAIWIERRAPSGTAQSVNGHTSSHPRPQVSSTYVAPRNEVEEKVVAIWQEVLGIQQVGIHDNFFDLGGHSLLATRLVARLRQAFQVDLPLAKFFESATVLNIAEAIQGIQHQEADEDALEILQMLAELSEEDVEEELKKREAV